MYSMINFKKKQKTWDKLYILTMDLSVRWKKGLTPWCTFTQNSKTIFFFSFQRSDDLLPLYLSATQSNVLSLLPAPYLLFLMVMFNICHFFFCISLLIS